MKNETFASLMQSFSYRYDLRSVFDDFLTMSICAMSQNPVTGKSHDEDLYLETIEKYKNDDLRHTFPKLFAAVVVEMEDGLASGNGNDVLGSFYELNLYRKGTAQYFTPWPICEFMSRIATGDDTTDADRPLRIMDSCCGSGRMLLATAQNMGREHHYYGIDIDHMCVKMAVINLFLNGVFHAEVMCADALNPNDFRVSYVTSFLPFRISRITEKEKSRLWQSQQALCKEMREKPAPLSDAIQLSSKNTPATPSTASQLNLF